MGKDYAITIDVLRPLHINEINPRSECGVDIDVSAAAIRGDDRLRRRFSDRVPIDGLMSKRIGANFDRVMVGVQRSDYIDRDIRRLLVNRDDELHCEESLSRAS